MNILVGPQLLDKFGRYATNLRVSVIDRCNFRCKYCIANESFNDWVPSQQILTFEEITRVVQTSAQLGIHTLRITGGEPLIRPYVPELIAKLNTIPGVNTINMTSNGYLVGKYLNDLEDAGLSTINMKLDTLNQAKFAQITRRNYFQTILQNIFLIKDSKINLKVNCVALKGFNDDEILDFVQFAISNNIHFRFIEFMPFDGNTWLPNSFISSAEIRNIISSKYTLIPEPLDNPAQTSRTYKIEGHAGRIGFVSSVTESFCSNCNRLRLTADGNLRPCLHGKLEFPLRDRLRKGITDDALKELIKQAVWNKQKEHVDFLSTDYILPIDDRQMIRIGG